MAGHSDPKVKLPESENYYASMADLLAGILFVMLVLLMSFAIIHYPDEASPPTSPIAPVAAPEIDARVARLQALERERAKLLNAIHDDLAAAGVTSAVDLPNGVLRIPNSEFFVRGTTRLTVAGQRHVQILAQVVRSRAACLIAPSSSCALPIPIILNGILIQASATQQDLVGSTFGDAGAYATSRGMAITDAMAAAEPPLLEARTPDGVPVLLAARGEVANNEQSDVTLGFGLALAEP